MSRIGWVTTDHGGSRTATQERPKNGPPEILVESDSAVYTGTVRWFSAARGYGFITGEDGKDIFVHFSAIQMKGYRTLDEGEKVGFEVCGVLNGLMAQNVLRENGQVGRDRSSKSTPQVVVLERMEAPKIIWTDDPNSEPREGLVLWFNRALGLGCIGPTDFGGKVRVYARDVLTSHHILQEGQMVEFQTCLTNRGFLAQSVRVVEDEVENQEPDGPAQGR